MEYYDAQLGCQIGALKEVVIEPNEQGRGWIVYFCDTDDRLSILTMAGQRRVFHTLGHASRLARDLGFPQVVILGRPGRQDSFIRPSLIDASRPGYAC